MHFHQYNADFQVGKLSIWLQYIIGLQKFYIMAISSVRHLVTWLLDRNIGIKQDVCISLCLLSGTFSSHI